jgi:hypothetical protein
MGLPGPAASQIGTEGHLFISYKSVILEPLCLTCVIKVFENRCKG